MNKNDIGSAGSAMVKVDVCGTEIDACRDEETIWISVRRVCDVLGLASNSQIAKLKNKPWAVGTFIVSTGPDGKGYKAFCLSHRAFPMWLATIEPSRSTSPNLRTLLARFQKEAADVLYRHFFGERQTAAAGMTAEQFAQAMTPVLSLMTALASRLTALEERVRDNGIMAPERASAIKARVQRCVDELARYGIEKKRKASLRIHKRLKMRVGWYGDHCRLDNMPARHEADVLREMEIVEHETNGAVAASRQLTLPRLAVVANNDVQKKRA